MESLKIIAYNREKDTVELLPASRDFDVYIETVKKGDIPWSQFYLGLSILAGIGSLAIILGLLNWVTIVQWMLFTNVIFITCSSAHMYQVQIYKR